MQMNVNPYNSPLLHKLQNKKHNQQMINMVKQNYVLLNICKHFSKFYVFKDIDDTHGYIKLNNQFYVSSKKKTTMRLISRLDWVYYEPKDLAHAIETDTVEVYYAKQLSNSQSYPNVWRDTSEEYDLKEYYANRAGRNLDTLDNL